MYIYIHIHIRGVCNRDTWSKGVYIVEGVCRTVRAGGGKGGRVDRVGSVEWLEGSERWRSVEGGRRW